MGPAQSEYLTVRQAASRLGYTVQHTRLLIRHGRLAAVKLGRDWLVSREAVFALTDERARRQTDDA